MIGKLNLSGNSKTNGIQIPIYQQLNEPNKKNGIWIKTEEKIKDIFVYTYSTNDDKYMEVENPIPFNFDRGTAVTIGVDIYMFGSNGTTSYVYKYGTLTKQYTELAVPLESLRYHTTALIENDIYIFIGRNIYKYNTSTNEYTTLIQSPRSWLLNSIATVGTDIYLFYDTDAYKYDTLTNTYTQLANIPVSFRTFTSGATTVGTDIYLFGGDDTNHNLAYKYNTLTNTYTQLADIPYKYYRSSIVAEGGSIYLFGGEDNLTEKYKYNTITNKYIKLADMPINLTLRCSYICRYS